MRVYESKKTQNSSGLYSALYHGLSVLFLCLGICGMIFMAASVPEIGINVPLLVLSAVILILALYFSNHFSKPLFYLVLGGMVAFCIIFIFTNRESFAEEWQFIFSGMIPDTGETSVSVDHVALVLTLLFSLLFFFFDCMLKLHGISFIISTAFMLIPTIFGYSFPPFAIIMTVVWQLAFFILPVVYGNRLFTRSDKTQQKIRVKSTLLAVLAAFAALAIAAPIAIANSGTAFTRIARMEEGMLLSLGITPVSMLYNNEGDINRGDNEKTGLVNLQLTTDKLPDEPLYLRGYFGGNYYGDYWDAPTDNVIFEEISKVSDISSDPSELADIYNSLRYRTTVENRGDDQSANVLDIKSLNINRSIVFSPYNSIQTDSEKRGSVSFKYFSNADLSVGFSDSDPDALLKLRKLFRDYYDDAYDNYTYVTAESVPELKKLVAAHPLDDLGEITDFIINTLEANAEYTLSPGTAPEGADVIDYFLFENHKGYCQQFASAAVMMYRLYGVPARYATGFRVTPSAFTETEGDQGGFSAKVSDHSAHAWPEILLPEYGWTPIEVTPAQGQSPASWNNMPQNTGQDPLAPENKPAPTNATEGNEDTGANGEGSEEVAENGASGELPENEGEGGSSSSGASSSSGEGSPEKINAADVLPWLLPVCIGGGLVAAWFGIRKMRVSALENMSFETGYKKLTALLKLAPEPMTCMPSDKAFPEELIKAVPVISREEADKYYDMMIRALYSKAGATKEDTAEMNSLYKKCAEYITQHSPAGKKAVIKYIKMLG